MNFKERVLFDVKNTFLDANVFADTHNVNGKDMPVIIDNNEQLQREKRFSQHIDGVYENSALIYVSSSDFGDLPAQGSYIRFDGNRYKVTEATEEYGVYAITIAMAQTVPSGSALRGLR